MANSSGFADVYGSGHSRANIASDSGGVRPAFIARLKCGLYRPCKLNQLKGAAVLSFLDK